MGRVLHDTFVIDAPIGEGGMGVVYAAHNAKTPGIRYAVKVLRSSGGHASDAQRFRREAQALAALDHPSIVRPIHVDVTPEGDPYLVMEFVSGASLRERLASATAAGESLPVPFVLTVLDGIADALDHAHGRGVIHRDLKPENVLVVERGRSVVAKVLDFGIAKLVQPDGTTGGDNLTRTTELAGTVAYMSPEQCRDLRSAGAPSDRYTLGIIAFELLTQGRPFDGTNAASTICNILLNPLPDPTLRAPGLPAAVTTVLERACAKDPAARFPSASEFVAALAEALGVPLGTTSVRTHAVAATADPMPVAVQTAPTIRADLADATLPDPPTTLDQDRGPLPTVEARPPTPLAAEARVPMVVERTMASGGGGGGSSRWLAATGVVVVAAVATAWGVVHWARRRLPPTPPSVVTATRSCTGTPRAATPGLYDDEVCLPGGTFTMGSPPGEGDADEHPAHVVEVAPFYLDRYEVTVARYRRCVAGGGCDPTNVGSEGPYDEADNYDPRGHHFRASPHCTYRAEPSTHDTLPMNCLSFEQAVQVCRYEGRRLPSEAEWERAARGLGEAPRPFPWGSEPVDCNHAAYGYGAGCGLADPVEVGTARAGATPDQVFDLAGNVFEWTTDWYDDGYYARSPAANPPGATLDVSRVHGGDPVICRDGCRVTRGGAWLTPTGMGSWLRGAHRTSDASARRGAHLGVRCARTP